MFNLKKTREHSGNPRTFLNVHLFFSLVKMPLVDFVSLNKQIFIFQRSATIEKITRRVCKENTMGPGPPEVIGAFRG